MLYKFGHLRSMKHKKNTIKNQRKQDLTKTLLNRNNELAVFFVKTSDKIIR